LHTHAYCFFSYSRNDEIIVRIRHYLASLLVVITMPGLGHATGTELANQRVRLVVDPAQGTYDIIDQTSGHPIVSGAGVIVGDSNSQDAAYTRTVSVEPCQDALGAGRRLRMVCKAGGKPDLIFEAVLHDDDSHVVIRAGLVNNTAEPIRPRSIIPLNNGSLPPLKDSLSLTGPSGANAPIVSHSGTVSSPNSLLLTGKDTGGRRSIVMGALSTADFTKWVTTCTDRVPQLNSEIPNAKLVAYRSANGVMGTLPSNVTLAVTEGKPYSFPGVDFAKPELRYAIGGLDPNRRYAVGLVWLDVDSNGRVGSIAVRSSGGENYKLAEAIKLPQGRKNDAASELGFVLPSNVYADGKCSLILSTNNACNIVASEVYLWEIPPDTKLDPSWASGRPVKNDLDQDNASTLNVRLEARDPVGHRVLPGETYVPDDSFIVDAGVADPFAALEKYALTLRANSSIKLNYYTYPTICAWYAGVWKTKGAENHPEKSAYQINTTSGLVAEADQIARTGFLRYSPVAGRLVPDNYTKNTPQGWWDDAHWRKQGSYTAPYETTEKFGDGMHQRGCLAYTYIQPANNQNRLLISYDFRASHTDWLLGKNIINGIDYSLPVVQEYVRTRFAVLRNHIDGIMVDYCDDLWGLEASKGQFADPSMSATAYYRMFFTKLRQGIGPSAVIHERNLGGPNNDLTLGIVDSQRTEGDNDRISPVVVGKDGLRWYKNRVLYNYDMDSKDLTHSWKVNGWNGTDQDGLRMMLTMAYVASGRLLMANSFRDLSAETIHDLSRIFPYPSEPKSARPIDAFTRPGESPMVYDYAVNAGWHQVTLYNTALPGKPQTISVPLSGDQVDGALGLDAAKSYHVYDFWNDTYVGRLSGSSSLVQDLRSAEARMLAVHEVEPNPQFIATDRHLMQGLLDLSVKPVWNPATNTLSGTARVIANEPFRIIIATNGRHPSTATSTAANATTAIKMVNEAKGLAALTINAPVSAEVPWSVTFP